MKNFFYNWFLEPLGWISQQYTQPKSLEKFFESLSPSEKQAYKKRTNIILGFFALFSLGIGALNFKFFQGWGFWAWLVCLVIFTISHTSKELTAKYFLSGIGSILFLNLAAICMFYNKDIAFWPSVIISAIIGVVAGMGGFDSVLRKDSTTKTNNSKTFSSDLTNISFLTILMIFNLNITFLVSFLVFLFSAFFTFYPIPSYLLAVFSLEQTNAKSIREPQRTIEFLRQSRLYSYDDESIKLDLPNLKKILQRAAIYNWREVRSEIAWLIANRPSQANLARFIIIEYLVNDLKELKTLLDLAGAKERLESLLPNSEILQNTKLTEALQRVGEISDYAREYCEAFGVQTTTEPLEKASRLIHYTLTELNKENNKASATLVKLLINWDKSITNEKTKIARQVWQVI